MIEIKPDVFRQIQASVLHEFFGFPVDALIADEILELHQNPVQLSYAQLTEIGLHVGVKLAALQYDGEIRKTQIDAKYLRRVHEKIRDARDALRQCVDELDIAPDVKRYIQSGLDRSEIDLMHPDKIYHHAAYADDRVTVYLIPTDFTVFGDQVGEWFHQEASENIFSAEVVGTVGHELGHGIEWILAKHFNEEIFPSVRYGDSFMSDFPFQWDEQSTEEAHMISEMYRWAKRERFADYFRTALIHGLGYPETVRADRLRAKLSSPFNLGLTLDQLRQVIVTAEYEFSRRSDALTAEEKMRGEALIDSFATGMYCHSGFTELFPFSRPVVETIISAVWGAGEAQLLHKSSDGSD